MFFFCLFFLKNRIFDTGVCDQISQYADAQKKNLNKKHVLNTPHHQQTKLPFSNVSKKIDLMRNFLIFALSFYTPEKKQHVYSQQSFSARCWWWQHHTDNVNKKKPKKISIANRVVQTCINIVDYWLLTIDNDDMQINGDTMSVLHLCVFFK